MSPSGLCFLLEYPRGSVREASCSPISPSPSSAYGPKFASVQTVSYWKMAPPSVWNLPTWEVGVTAGGRPGTSNHWPAYPELVKLRAGGGCWHSSARAAGARESRSRRVDGILGC
jgi:hypothetical protein